jgi:hypothetical protein
MQQSIVVEHQEGSDFAIVIVASRNDYGRREIVPMIFACEGCGVLAAAPMVKMWVKAGLLALYNPPADKREELLRNAVIEFSRQVALRSFIKERSKVGIVARAKARREEFNNSIEGFEISAQREPAFAWLFEHSENVQQALRVARYLIAKHKIGELTLAEREAHGEKLLAGGDKFKTIWRQQ